MRMRKRSMPVGEWSTLWFYYDFYTLVVNDFTTVSTVSRAVDRPYK